MFDKNEFKNSFRRFLASNPQASEEDAWDFCHRHIPAHTMASHYWLVEQSVEWFKWTKSQQAIRNGGGSDFGDLNMGSGAFEEEPH